MEIVRILLFPVYGFCNKVCTISRQGWPYPMVHGLRADKYFCRIAMKSDGNGKNIDIDIVIAG